MTYSFDIFDTCLVRKCGTPENMLDVLSLRVFKEPVEEWVRQEFVVARREAESKMWKENMFVTLADIYDVIEFSCSVLVDKPTLVQVETELENEMLVPVLKMRNRIDAIRAKGHHIIYISDMYLSDKFVRDKMTEYGFLKDGDSLYVSDTIGQRKQDGKLYEYICSTEHLDYRSWEHVGDNDWSDYIIPRRLGIKAKQISWGYKPYPQYWLNHDYSLQFKYKSICAGLSRAYDLCLTDNSHKAIILDIIAPFYCSWVYHVMKDANKKGIKRLYFCARDSHHIFNIARKMLALFPELSIEYFYMSRIALYEGDICARMLYLQQIGIATTTEKVAIVDTTTTGKTIAYLNDELEKHGFSRIYSYYYQMWHKYENANMAEYNLKVRELYINQNPTYKNLFWNNFIYENFFSLNNEYKTIDYTVVNGEARPVFDESSERKECFIADDIDWASVHESILDQYTSDYIQLGLYKYSELIFDNIVMPTLADYFELPYREYVEPLCDFYSNYDLEKGAYPCVQKQNPIVALLKVRRKYHWRKGTLAMSLPTWMIKIKKAFNEK